MRYSDRHAYLRRLPPKYYRGRAYVHWSLTVEDRKTGWLHPSFHQQHREMLTHAAFRFGFCVPIYCWMPDHLHMLWIGVCPACDQRTAMRYFRRHLNPVLEEWGVRFQLQAYDHVMREKERDHGAFEEVANYIARNPERAGLVPPSGFAAYAYSGCVVPGYPELRPFEESYWERFWRVYSHLAEYGLHAKGPTES